MTPNKMQLTSFRNKTGNAASKTTIPTVIPQKLLPTLSK